MRLRRVVVGSPRISAVPLATDNPARFLKNLCDVLPFNVLQRKHRRGHNAGYGCRSRRSCRGRKFQYTQRRLQFNTARENHGPLHEVNHKDTKTQRNTICVFVSLWLNFPSLLQSLWSQTVKHLTMEELEAALDHLRQAPKDQGILELIVRRPATDQREVLEEAELDPVGGLIGDDWSVRGSRRTRDGSAHPEMQINIMNARVTALVAQDKDHWPLAGDQLYLDMDLSKENLPAGSRFTLGSAVLEVSALPHTGCHKFVSRFGVDAMKFVNSEVGKELCLRGINARVVQAGVVKKGDTAKKIR